MGKAILHSLIDMLSENDTETIYNVLIRFVPEDKPLPDEADAIKHSRSEIENGDVISLSAVNWES